MSEFDLGSPFLKVSVEDHVMTVRIDRVDRRNAMTQAMYRGVKRAAILVDGDPEVSCSSQEPTTSSPSVTT